MPGMQLPNSPEEENKAENLPGRLLKSNGETKQPLMDGANGRHRQPGNTEQEVITIMALIGCYHMTGQPISSFSPTAEAGYK